MELNERIEEILENANEEIRQAINDHNKGIKDCQAGVYDKWFRYHRKDDGLAYEIGWKFQNRITQNTNIRWIEQ